MIYSHPSSLVIIYSFSVAKSRLQPMKVCFHKHFIITSFKFFFFLIFLLSLPASDGNDNDVMFENKDDAREAFKTLLTEKGCRSTWPWDKAMRQIASDPRFNALKRMNERKQVSEMWCCVDCARKTKKFMRKM